MLYNEAEFEKTRKKVHIVWFKRDLRVADHEPLWYASEVSFSSDYAVLPLYTFEPAMWHLSDASQRQFSFILDSLKSLDLQLQRRNNQLYVYKGSMIDTLNLIAEKCEVVGLWSHQETGNDWTFQRDKSVAMWCQQSGVQWTEFAQHAVVRGGLNRDRYQRVMDGFFEQMARPAPRTIPSLNMNRQSDWSVLEGFEWAQDQWVAGESIQPGGRELGVGLLKSFLEHRHQRYVQTLSKPAESRDYSSRLSPHLAWGTLSIREVVQAAERQPGSRGLSAFKSRTRWQSHFMQKLESEPEMEYRSLLPACDELRPWDADAEMRFQAWLEGRTGIPLVDACMRSLRQTGWITFRMRAMLVSFASYQLWLPWQKTAPALARLFTDYEPGIHYSQIQMQSGVTGINQIRVYNPIKQAMDHDPKGHFVRQWCPEYRDVSDTWIHQPWLQTQIKVPQSIVDNDRSAKEAKDKVYAVRKEVENRLIARGVFIKHGSRKRPTLRRTPRKKPKDDSQMELFE